MKKTIQAALALAALYYAGGSFTSVCRAGDVGFAEDFALAKDRAAVLKQLIPGTEDYYYYNALHCQNLAVAGAPGELDKVEALLKLWIERHGQTARVEEIRNRQALLGYDKDHKKSLEFIRWRMGLNFDHQKETLDQKPNNPTKLDQALINREALKRIAFSRYENLQGFEQSALDFLAAEKLTPIQRRHLISRLQRPDFANLAQLVVGDLRFENSGGFGSFGIHRQLLLSQLDECLKLMPDLRDNTPFIDTYLTKLHPAPDVDWQHDAKEKEAFLDRLWAFVQKLQPAHNSLKAFVLYQRLQFDRTQGIYDKARFMEYLKLPRNAPYMNTDYLNRPDLANVQASLEANFQEFVPLAPIQNDEPLVRDYLMHFFVAENSFAPYAVFIQDSYLKEVFAETKIVNGIGDMEKWYSMLGDPAKYQALKERVDIEFPVYNKVYIRADEAVSLDADVKNVKTLIVKVYEINTVNYYRDMQREVDTSINLDGLVANEENSYNYDEVPLRRVRRHFEFQSLKKPGVYVVEFIGNGTSSRALIRKGQLHYLERIGTAGHVFTVLDESNTKLKDASIWLSGHEFLAGKDGEIVVPFSTSPKRETIVLKQAAPAGSVGFASLDTFQHRAETYTLNAGIYVDREALLKRKTARVLIRPALYVNDTPVALSVLERISLQIQTVDRENVSTTKDIPDFKLSEDQESVFEFQVPENLLQITFTLKAQVQNLSLAQKVDLAASQHFVLNQIDTSEKVEDLHLSHVESGYILYQLGKNGEARADKPVLLTLKHRDFLEAVSVTLQTDADGRIDLGALQDIVEIKTSGGNAEHTWYPTRDLHNYASTINSKQGDVVRVPYMGREKQAARTSLSLIEMRGGTFFKDRFENAAIKDGFVEIKDLTSGDFELLLKESGTAISLHVNAGEFRDGYILSDHRLLQVRDHLPLQIVSVEAGADTVKIKLANSSKYARVHVVANRLVPAYPMYHLLGVPFDEPSLGTLPKGDSYFLSGRNIGDEFRYIFDRKYALKFPGNMLKRPALLLNPWTLNRTDTITTAGEGNGSFGSRNGGGRRLMVKRHGGSKDSGSGGEGIAADLDFLNSQSVVLTNLKPDADGIVTIARKDIGSLQHIRVVAVDPENTVFREIALPEVKFERQDLRLLTGLDSKKHFTEQKQISIIDAGKDFVLSDITTSSIENYDSLRKVYGLFATLSLDAKLMEFDFILNWPKLKPEEKREKYSKYASHELSFFLSRKDPEFFKTVVQPYLKNKKDKTFIDQYLLDEDLSAYLSAWAYQRLNVVERILLAHRLKGEQAAALRHVSDLYDLLPPDIERYNFLFKTALKSGALETSDALGLDKARKLVENLKKVDPNFPPPEMPKTAAAPSVVPQENAPAKPAADGKADQALEQTSPAMRNKDVLAKAEISEEAGEAKEKDAAGKNGVEAELAAGLLDDRGRREAARQFYRKLEKTEELAENNYHHLPIEEQKAELITVNEFWKDFAGSVAAGRPTFLSTHLAEASHNFPEMMFALSLLDLPFEAEKHGTAFKGTQMTLSAKSPIVIFHKEIKESLPAAEKTPILVSQNFFRYDDRYRFENNERYDKYVFEEFLVHTVYGCQIVLTNPTSSPQKLELLQQIPSGAIPVLNGFYTRGQYVQLQPYSTMTFEYYFYFPAPGLYPHYPIHVAKNEKMIASAEPITLKVVAKLTKIDVTSWDYISQNGTPDEVLAFLKANNVNRLALEKIAWRMHDAPFFKTILGVLNERHIYNSTLWSYGIFHDDVPAIREFLKYADAYINQCGAYIDCKLVTLDPVERRSYQHLEYSPLVNARAHRFGRQRKILNDRFFEQYSRLMNVLSCRPNLDDTDCMAASFYLLLQDRVEEGVGFFARVEPNKIPTRIQYDYLKAYLDFYSTEHKSARGIATAYKDYPVDRWRMVFLEVASQLDEIESKPVPVADKDDHAQQQARLAATEASFEFKVESRKINVTFQNLAECQVQYYLMDIEALFSGNPFVQQYAGQFAFIRPNRSETVRFPEKRNAFEFDLPKEYHSSNVMVEIVAGGVRKSQAYYANALAVQVIENYGQVKVMHQATGAPLAKVYVKVYAKMKSGEVAFFKDGYTDLRGRFDYASLSTNEIDNVEKFSLLAMSETDGAVIREAMPPKQ